MSRYTLRNQITPGRLAWLKTLEAGPTQRGRGPVGFQCMRLGWTRWVNISDGVLEELTEEGRAALKAYRDARRIKGQP